MDHGALIAEFVSITGSDEDHALSTLEACDWNLETAVGLFFASGGHEGHNPTTAGAASSKPVHAGEDDVRAPIASKVERLYDGPSGMPDRFSTIPLQRAPQRQAPPVDVFRDYKAEGEAGGSSKEGSGSAGLGALFAAPTAILFKGGRFQQAKEAAAQQGRWLVVNIQTPNEFASHRLNRDTWSNEALQEMVKGSFVFYQVQDSVDDGLALQTNYRVQELPCIMIIDPITGAKLYERSGFVDAEGLTEVLVQFMEHGPKDPGAGQLAYTMSLKRKAPAAAAGASRQAGGSSAAAPLTEDEQLARAIAMSMEEGGGRGGAGASQGEGSSGGGGYESDDEEDGIDEEAIWAEIRRKEAEAAAAAAKPKPEEVMAAAKERLPPEPADSEPGRCRVAIRFPDGSRVNRKFLKTHAVQALYDFVLSTVQEAADGRAFVIAPSIPGSSALEDKSAELQTVGAADALVVVRWS